MPACPPPITPLVPIVPIGPARRVPHRRRRSRPVAAAAVALAIIGVSVVGVGAANAPTLAPAGAQVTTTTTAKSTTTTTTRAASTTTATKPATTAAPTTTAAPATTTAAPTSSVPVGTLAPPTPAENSPFPAALVGPVPHLDGGPELDISDIYAAISEDLTAPDVVVRFRAPFALPSGPYKVSVLVGDPTAARLRASLVSSGANAKPRGVLETREGNGWREIGPTPATFQPGGFAIVRVPFASAPPGGAVWAEITSGTGTTPARTTPYFSRDGLFATATPKGSLPISPIGRVTNADGTISPDPVVLDGGPVLRVGRELVSVTSEMPAPTELLGQPVKEVVDIVRIVPNFDNGAVIGHYVRIDRGDDTATLFDGFSATPTDKSGDRAWIASTTPAGGKAGSGTIMFSRPRLGEALGIELPPGTPATMYRVGFGVMRTIVLADGRVITSEAVIGTDAWFGLGPEPTVPTTTVPAAPSVAVVEANDDRLPIYVAGGAAAVILLGAVLLLVSRRRRRSRRADDDAGADDGLDRVPWARDDGLVTARATAEIEAIRATGTVPAIVDAPATVTLAPVSTEAVSTETTAPAETAADVETTADAGTTAAAGAPAEVETPEPLAETPEPPAAEVPAAPEPPAAEVPAAPEPSPEPAAETPASAPLAELAERDPMAALAALDLQVSAFRSRLDDLEDESGASPAGAAGPDPDAG